MLRYAHLQRAPHERPAHALVGARHLQHGEVLHRKIFYASPNLRTTYKPYA